METQHVGARTRLFGDHRVLPDVFGSLRRAALMWVFTRALVRLSLPLRMCVGYRDWGAGEKPCVFACCCLCGCSLYGCVAGCVHVCVCALIMTLRTG